MAIEPITATTRMTHGAASGEAPATRSGQASFPGAHRRASPAFFEQLVVYCSVAMKYGGSYAEAAR